jgi:hypothetical protein
MWAQVQENIQLLNGEVWESPAGVRGMAQWLDDYYWVLLSVPQESGYGGTRMEAFKDGERVHFFTHGELHEWLQRNQWKKIDARIALQVS